MIFFCIEWFHAGECVYKQEYFLTMEAASKRFIMLRDNVPSSNPDIATQRMEDA